MTKNNKITAVLGVFMVLIVLLVLFFIKTSIDLKIPVDTKEPADNMSVNAQNPVKELRVGGLSIEFEIPPGIFSFSSSLYFQEGLAGSSLS